MLLQNVFNKLSLWIHPWIESYRPSFLPFIILFISLYIFNLYEGWSWYDIFYFLIVQLSTTGYGDFVPSTNLTRLFTVFLITRNLFYVYPLWNGIVTRKIRDMLDDITKLSFQYSNNTTTTNFNNSSKDKTSFTNTTTTTNTTTNNNNLHILFRKKLLLKVFIILIISIGVLFGRLTNMDWITSLYWTMQTLSTVGFGDISLPTFYEKLFKAVYLAFGMFAFGAALTLLDENEQEIQMILSPSRTVETTMTTTTTTMTMTTTMAMTTAAESNNINNINNKHNSNHDSRLISTGSLTASSISSLSVDAIVETMKIINAVDTHHNNSNNINNTNNHNTTTNNNNNEDESLYANKFKYAICILMLHHQLSENELHLIFDSIHNSNNNNNNNNNKNISGNENDDDTINQNAKGYLYESEESTNTIPPHPGKTLGIRRRRSTRRKNAST